MHTNRMLIRIRNAILSLSVFLLLTLCLFVLLRGLPVSKASPAIFQGELERSGTKTQDYSVTLPENVSDDAHEQRSFNVALLPDDKYTSLQVSLVLSDEVVWTKTIAKYTKRLSYEVALSEEHIVVDLFVEQLTEATGSHEIHLLPATAGQPHLSFDMVTICQSRVHGKRRFASVLLDMTGQVLDVKVNAVRILNDKCKTVHDILVCSGNDRIEIGTLYANGWTEQNIPFDVDSVMGPRAVFSSTKSLECIGLYRVADRSVLAVLLFQDTLLFHDEALYTWQPPHDLFGVNTVAERCLGIFLLSEDFELKWGAYLGPVHHGSESAAAFTHLTTEDELLIGYAYRYNTIFTDRHGEAKAFSLATPSKIGVHEPNVYQAIASISLTGDITFVRQIAKGFLWTDTLLRISDNHLYLSADAGSVLSFVDRHHNPVAIRPGRPFSCVLKMVY